VPGLDARPAQLVAGEPGEKVMLVVDLLELRPPAANAASVADGATPSNALCCYVVAAMTVMLVADALATIALGARRAHANLVGEAGGGTTRDKVATGSLVAGEDLFAVEPV